MSGKRISLYISPEVDSDLVLLSRRMGISKSALVSNLLAIPLKDLISMFSMLPEKPDGADVLRFKGKSMDIVNSRVESMRELLETFPHD